MYTLYVYKYVGACVTVFVALFGVEPLQGAIEEAQLITWPKPQKVNSRQPCNHSLASLPQHVCAHRLAGASELHQA